MTDVSETLLLTYFTLLEFVMAAKTTKKKTAKKITIASVKQELTALRKVVKKEATALKKVAAKDAAVLRKKTTLC